MIDAHLDDTAWEKLALGEVDDGVRTARLRHIAACATCSRIWIGLRALEGGAQAIDPMVAATSAGLDADKPAEVQHTDQLAPRRRRIGRAMVIGGAAIVAAAAVMLLWMRPGGSHDGDADVSDVVRGNGVAAILVQPVRDRFAWTAVATATSYRLAVYDPEGRAVWGPTVVATPPVGVPDTLQAGAYRWRVEAIRGSAVIARSPLVAFSVNR